ncbi:hypothetical protein QRD89_02295 [Halobacillus sp. ACCC02827]|uniref:hypothetical protein n=1 Tax=Halobacillus sp. ACCC02827 TaxID=3052090 RepID=UPI002570C35B|nr:hypothetical protein [Halobacillus sp. ACCC02827]WJE16200.1 hypothetical protein QRD89_02295 [Halobacillus sp. ACCC02827]
MGFQWYEVVENSKDVTQGDIILDCPVSILEEHDEYPYFKKRGAIIDVIVMTQACDLENDEPKVDEITLCPIEPVKNYLKARMEQHYEAEGVEDFDFEDLKTKGQRKKKVSLFDKLRKGETLDYYLLNSFFESDFSFTYHIVGLRDSYRIPVNSINKIVKEKPGNRLRLLPPYREHLAHNFAFNFSRIGLPIDIKAENEEIYEI